MNTEPSEVTSLLLADGWSFQLDGWIIIVACLCAISCATVGNFLVLRRMSLLGDAITHAVLPGLAVAFLVSGSRSSPIMFIGAVVVGVLTAFFTQWIRRIGDVDEGASMGVVFTSLFALGLVLIVQAADRVDLDAGCVLYGSIEYTPLNTTEIFGFDIPQAAVTLGIVAIINLIFVTLFFKELRISSFDPALATSMGFSAQWLHYGLMVLVAITSVASFESVGSVLVVAMLIVPAATAYLLTDRLSLMIGISIGVGIVSAVLGHFSATRIPAWFGFGATTTSSMMAVMAGCLLLLSALFSPRYGYVIRWWRQHSLARQILADDIVAYLYRVGERSSQASASVIELQDELFCVPRTLRAAIAALSRKEEVKMEGDQVSLTESGLSRASRLIRSHRLWEQYLQEHAGLPASRLHEKAERLEHFTDEEMRARLDNQMDLPAVDPHGKPIPQEE
jgi:manganese/zinc/iron transport system permease protein